MRLKFLYDDRHINRIDVVVPIFLDDNLHPDKLPACFLKYRDLSYF